MKQEPMKHRAAYHRLTAWLGVFGLLIQTAVPDLAMASRNIVPAELDLHVANVVGHFSFDSDQGAPSKPVTHDHASVCPFCLVQAAPLLPPAPAAGPRTVSLTGTLPALPAEMGALAALHFLSCVRSRAPPPDKRA
jgi:hypothetical protein